MTYWIKHQDTNLLIEEAIYKPTNEDTRIPSLLVGRDYPGRALPRLSIHGQ